MVDIRQTALLYQQQEIQIIHIIGQFLDAFLFIYLLQNFFEPRRASWRSWKSLTGVSCLFAILLAVTDLAMHNSFYSYAAVMVAFPFLYVCLGFHGKVLIKALICCIFFSIMSSLEHFVIYLAMFLSDDFIISRELYIALFVVRRILSKAVLFWVIKFFMVDVVRVRLKGINGYWYFMGLVSVLDFLIFRFILTMPEDSTEGMETGLVLAAFCIAVPMGCFYTIRLMLKLAETSRVLVAQDTWVRMQSMQMRQLEDMQKELQKFRHDYRTHLLCMDGFVEEKNYKGLHEYLEKLHQFQQEAMTIVPYTGNNGLDMLLNQKRRMAEERGIRFEIEIREDVKPRRIQVYDLNALLANLLDNALDAAEQVEEGKIRLLLTRRKAYLKAEVENSAAGNVLKENPKFETWKKDKELHGLGVKIIKNIVETYEGMYHLEAEEGSFKVIVLLMDE